jgi:hypothetical protein
MDFGGKKLWFLGSPYRSVDLAGVSQRTIELVMQEESKIVNFVAATKTEYLHDAACLLVKRDTKGVEFEKSAKFSYFACDHCIKKDTPCIRATAGGFTVRPRFHGAKNLWTEADKGDEDERENEDRDEEEYEGEYEDEE